MNPHFRSEPDAEDSEGKRDRAAPSVEPPCKKKKKNTPRPAKGEDFWGQFDMLMRTLRTEKGSNFSNKAWKE